MQTSGRSRRLVGCHQLDLGEGARLAGRTGGLPGLGPAQGAEGLARGAVVEAQARSVQCAFERVGGRDADGLHVGAGGRLVRIARAGAAGLLPALGRDMGLELDAVGFGCGRDDRARGLFDGGRDEGGLGDGYRADGLVLARSGLVGQAHLELGRGLGRGCGRFSARAARAAFFAFGKRDRGDHRGHEGQRERSCCKAPQEAS